METVRERKTAMGMTKGGAPTLEFDDGNPVLDYYIIPNANAVVDEKALEAAAEAMHEAWLECMAEFAPKRTEGMVPWVELPEGVKEVNRRGIRRGIESLNITVVDEVVELLEQIARGEGQFSRDPMEHAGNCIEDMKAKAVAALAILIIKRKQD